MFLVSGCGHTTPPSQPQSTIFFVWWLCGRHVRQTCICESHCAIITAGAYLGPSVYFQTHNIRLVNGKKIALKLDSFRRGMLYHLWGISDHSTGTAQLGTGKNKTPNCAANECLDMVVLTYSVPAMSQLPIPRPLPSRQRRQQKGRCMLSAMQPTAGGQASASCLPTARPLSLHPTGIPVHPDPAVGWVQSTGPTSQPVPMRPPPPPLNTVSGRGGVAATNS